MTMTDEEFREEYKPIHIPAHYNTADTEEHKIIYALAQIGDGTVTDITAELEKLEPGIVNEQLTTMAKTVLLNLYDKGLLTGHEVRGSMHYNFHKITQANDGSVNTARH